MQSVNSNSKVYVLRPILVDRGRVTEQISMFPDARMQTQTKMFSVFCEMSVPTAAVSGLSAACSMHVVRQLRNSPLPCPAVKVIGKVHGHRRRKDVAKVIGATRVRAFLRAGSVMSFRDHVKLLGVTLDATLTMDRHITEVIRSCIQHTTHGHYDIFDHCLHLKLPRWYHTALLQLDSTSVTLCYTERQSET